MFSKLKTYAKHLPGWSTKRKLVVLESDDWGSTRMPNRDVRKALEKKKIHLGNSNFLKYDTLATKEDLDRLFEVLQSVKDKNGGHVVFSPFVNVTNADFGQIAKSNYEEYVYEPFTETLKRYYGSDVFDAWKNGIENRIFSPQYHGREHFNVPLMMQMLRSGHKELREAFKLGVVHIPLKNNRNNTLKSLAPAYYFSSREELAAHQAALSEGVNIFEQIFSKPAGSFAAPNGIFHPEMEKVLADTSVENLVVNRNRVEPGKNGKLRSRNFLFKFGKKNKHGHIYYRRNVKFEPVQKQYSRAEMLFQVDAAFRLGKPAVISSHRINYVGAIDTEHRDRNLKEFQNILECIVKKHSDIEFISSRELGKIIRDEP